MRDVATDLLLGQYWNHINLIPEWEKAQYL